MSVVERINKLQQAGGESLSIPSSRLQEVLSRSQIESSVEELSQLVMVKIQKELIEGGKKMVVVVLWPSSDEGVQNKLVVSIREDSISFIGNSERDQYLRMEGQQVFDKELAEEYLARTFINPSRVTVLPLH